VQPLIALGGGLKAAGYDVRCATHADFEPAVRELGLEFYKLPGGGASWYSGPAGVAMQERLRNAREFARFYDNYLSHFAEQMLIDCWAACRDADAIFCWSWNRFGPTLSESFDVPVFIVSVNPVSHLPTRAFANPFQGPRQLRLGPLYNLLTWRLALPLLRMSQPLIDRWRQEECGLPVVSWREDLKHLCQLPHLFGYSPAVLPKPNDWADWIHVTGYWFMDHPSTFHPAPELEAFLAAGPPPVAIGFISQVGRDAAQITRTVVEALNLARKRGILISGFGGLKGVELPEHVFPVKTVPYDWLFPRVAAMVHHGGSGSTAAALRAGLPNFAVPFGYEQGLWGRQIADLGVGVAPIFADKLKPANLAKAICKVTEDSGIRSRVAQLGETLRAEDGIGTAVGVVGRILDGRPGKRGAVRYSV
jgi:UDP:flavonoid glycosyltransferase YjiC (YdhE family)